MTDIYSRIIGTGSYLPNKVLTNKDLEKMVDTSDEWIRTRSGIRERRVSHVPASDLAAVAGFRGRSSSSDGPIA